MAAIPPNKRVLNTHIAADEHEWLKKRAQAQGVTITIALRQILWEARKRELGTKAGEKP